MKKKKNHEKKKKTSGTYGDVVSRGHEQETQTIVEMPGVLGGGVGGGGGGGGRGGVDGGGWAGGKGSDAQWLGNSVKTTRQVLQRKSV